MLQYGARVADVAQGLERLTVTQEAEGSNPFFRPNSHSRRPIQLGQAARPSLIWKRPQTRP
jgi:hypothetical protein